MGTKLLAVAVLSFCPAIVLAQGQSDTVAKEARDTTEQSVTRTTSTGETSTEASGATEEMLKAQEDPNLIGSAAWWRRHATADGKPREATEPDSSR
jgi:hypothetical protein